MYCYHHRSSEVVEVKEGHEDCPHETVEEKALCDHGPLVRKLCLHTHTEPVRADDRLGTGPIVADYCECCGMIMRRADWR